MLQFTTLLLTDRLYIYVIQLPLIMNLIIPLPEPGGISVGILQSTVVHGKMKLRMKYGSLRHIEYMLIPTTMAPMKEKASSETSGPILLSIFMMNQLQGDMILYLPMLKIYGLEEQ